MAAVAGAVKVAVRDAAVGVMAAVMADKRAKQKHAAIRLKAASPRAKAARPVRAATVVKVVRTERLAPISRARKDAASRVPRAPAKAPAKGTATRTRNRAASGVTA